MGKKVPEAAFLILVIFQINYLYEALSCHFFYFFTISGRQTNSICPILKFHLTNVKSGSITVERLITPVMMFILFCGLSNIIVTSRTLLKDYV